MMAGGGRKQGHGEDPQPTKVAQIYGDRERNESSNRIGGV